PIMSGRIVDRRDHVLITFFSLRAFIPSTFSRRWLSMNGPFLSERPIVSPYVSALILLRLLFFHPAALDPLRAPQFPESAHGAGHTVRYRTERAHKPGALRVRRLFHGDRPSGLAQPVQHLHRYDGRKAADRLRRLCRRTRRAHGFAPARHPPCGSSGSPRSCCAHHSFLNFPSNTRRARLSIFPSGPKFAKTALRLPTLHNLSIRTSVPARLRAQGRKSPRRLRMVALHAAFTATVGV